MTEGGPSDFHPWVTKYSLADGDRRMRLIGDPNVVKVAYAY